MMVVVGDYNGCKSNFGLVMHSVFLAVQDNTIGDLVTHSETVAETEKGKKTETNRGRVLMWR